ncbi:NAD-binding protein [Melanogaster broomeanus]|nr:NAD-binding protein [Melanogaster broomeanus]
MSLVKGVAVVTGAAQGIGRAIALRLSHDGFDVAINDIPAKRRDLETLVEEVKTVGRQSIIVAGDVGQEEDVKKIIHATTEKLGGLRVMVANAGICRLGTMAETSLQQFEDVFAVNARGVFLCYKYAAQYMVAQGRGGRIFGASSVLGRQAVKMDYFAYAASKFAVRGMTQSAALELGRHGITVNCYAPGPIDTDMLRNVYKQRREQRAKPINTLGHEGKAEDIASIVSYLASDEARFITGQTIGIDGGYSIFVILETSSCQCWGC